MIKYLKSSVFILCIFPFVLIIYKIFNDRLGPEPVKEITHFTGEWTLIFICLTLAMSPLKRLTNFIFWTKIRRMLGLFVFLECTPDPSKPIFLVSDIEGLKHKPLLMKIVRYQKIDQVVVYFFLFANSCQ